MVTQERSYPRSPLSGPSDELLDARATLASLHAAKASLPHRMVAAAANSDTKEYTGLQMEASALPAKIRAAELAIMEADLAWHEDKLEASKAALESAATRLENLRKLAKEVEQAIDEARDDNGNIPLERTVTIRTELGFDPKALRHAREAWNNADAMVDEYQRQLAAKKAQVARYKFQRSL